MEGIFSLPYSEHEAINQIQKLFKKQDGYSILIPTSRQQKGIDFAILNLKNKKILKVQVKSSRSYLHNSKNRYRYNFWFNNFIDKYEKGIADIYILFGLYPVYSIKADIKSDFWKSIILVLTDEKMYSLLKKVKTKKEKKPDKFFSFGFDDEKHIYGTRGFFEKIDMSEFVLKNKEKQLRNLLK